MRAAELRQLLGRDPVPGFRLRSRQQLALLQQAMVSSVSDDALKSRS
jgi:hypothetical protein